MTGPNAASITVLHVDDDPDFVELAATFLERADDRFTVETATSASEGLDRLALGGVDCVVSDYDMTAVTGLEFLEAVRAEHPDLPFILFTGKGSEEVASDAISAGVTDYLQKEGGTSQYEVLANRVRNAVERHDAQTELADREQRLNLFFEQSPFGVIEWDESFRFVRQNAAAREILGYDDATLAGQSWEALVPASDRAAVDAVVSGLLADEGGYHSVNENVREDGERIVCEWHNRVVTDDGGDVVAVFSQFRDVTDREERKRELERYEAYLTESSDLITVLDDAGVIDYQSPSVERILGYEPGELIGENEFEYVHPEDREEVYETFTELVSDPGGVVSVECRFRTADGEWRWLEIRGTNQLHDDLIDGVVTNNRDITERKRRERAIATLHETARELVRAETAADVAGITTDAIQEVLEMPANVVHLYDPEANVLEPAAWTDAGEALVGEIPAIGPGEGLAWETFEGGDPQIHRDLSSTDGRFNPDTPVGSEVILPLGDHGTLTIGSPATDAFDETDVSVAQTLAAHVTTALDLVDGQRALERYEAIVENSEDGVYVFDADARVVFVNRRAVELSGVPREEWLGAPVSMFADRGILSEAEATTVEESIGALVRGDAETASVELAPEGPRGSRVIDLQLTALGIEDGPDQVIGFSRDVTDRTRREEALEEVQRRTQSLMHTSTAEETARIAVETAREVLDAPLTGVHLLSEDGQALEPAAFVAAVRDEFDEPPRYERETGADPAAAVVWEAYETGDSLVIDDTREHGRLAEVTPARSAIIHPLGEYGVFVVSATDPNAIDRTDEVLIEILSTALTAALDRVDRERRLRERERRLERERDRLTALFEMVPDPITHVRFEDGEPILIDVNRAFEDTFGFDAEAVVGRSLNDLIVPPDYLTDAERIDANARTEGGVNEEVRRQTVEGISDFLFRSVPIGDPDGTDEYLGIYVDITEMKTTERHLERQNERLEAFANIVSHDLRNPLSVAKARLDLAVETGDDEHLDHVANAHDRIETLIEDLLTLAREGEQVTDVDPVALADVVQSGWENVDTPDATLAVETEETVRADRSRLQQLLENLMRNAVKHGGATVTVTVGDLADRAGFYVADDGPGIPEDAREQVFEHGYSTTDDGTGFGLSIVREIAGAHGWEVAVTEGGAGGARFEVTGVVFE